MLVWTMTLVIGKDSRYRQGFIVQAGNYGIDMDSQYRHELMVQKWTHGRDIESWYRNELMVQIWTHGIDNTNGIELDSWYRIGTPESHMYERAKFCLYAVFFFERGRTFFSYPKGCFKKKQNIVWKNPAWLS